MGHFFRILFILFAFACPLAAQGLADKGVAGWQRPEAGDLFCTPPLPALELPSFGGAVPDSLRALLPPASMPAGKFLPEPSPVIPYYRNPSPMFRGDFSTSGLLWRHRMGMLMGAGRQETLPGIGMTNTASLTYLHQLSPRWSVAVGVEAVKISRPHATGQYVGFDGMLQYRATDRLTLRAFGSYVPGQNFGLESSGYGGSMQMQMTDRFDLELGVRRVYNTMTGRWETVPIAIPAYRFSPKVRIGFDVGGLLYELLRDRVIAPRHSAPHPHGATIAPPRLAMPPLR